MKQRVAGIGPERIAPELAGLIGLSRQKLRQRWRALYGGDPPEKSSQEFLKAGVAYRLQERAFGGLKPEIRRLLERAARDAKASTIEVAPLRQIQPGTVLIREWHGTRHQVTVLDDGAIYHGKRYRSLSEIARVITGSRWSGPLFFGLKSAATENGDDAR
jgi:DUF2924 family protein